MKKLYLSLATTILASSVMASGTPEVKLEGVFDFQGASRNQKNLGSDNMMTDNQKKSAFYSQGGITAKVSNTTDCGMTYGAQINIQTTSMSKGHAGSFIFMESDYGKIEAGSTLTAQSNMSVSAYNISAGTGDDWTRYAKLNPNVYSDGNGGTQGAYYGDHSDYSLVNSGYGNRTEQTRTVTYYTPKYNGIQLGVSYTPDASNTGDSELKTTKSSLFHTDVSTGDKTYDLSVKNLVGAGLTYENNIKEDLDVKVGVGYELGKTNTKRLVDTSPLVKFSDHKLYNVGAVLTYGNYSVAGSYANAGKSLTSSIYKTDGIKRKNILYTGGLAYNQGPVGVSLTYLGNERMNNKLDAFTLGTQYKIAPGFMQYAEVTSFKFRSKGIAMENNVKQVQNKKLDGLVYMLGLRVTF